MDKSEAIALKFRVRVRQSAFSLVEVTIAIGIAAFAFVAVFGLIPVGLNTFHQTMDISLGAQVIQRVVTEIQQTDFDTLTEGKTAPFLQTPTPRYFDEQGNELESAEAAIYQVNIKVCPVTYMPEAGKVPDKGNANLATVTVQIASNPGNINLRRDPETLLWSDRHVPINTHSAIVSRNK